METLLTILNKTTEYFKKHGVENARLDAELLLAHAVQCNRMQLYLDFERPMPEELLQRIRPLLKRRASREPVQYIIGRTGFMDFELFTDKRALIPRPETEELVELIAETFKSKRPPSQILDLGTGTGAIACALARTYPDSQVTATDISAETLELTKRNIEHLGLIDRVKCVESDWFANIGGTFDLIVSNPPYLSDAELLEVEPEVRKYEPARALSSGHTGMESIQVLLKHGPSFLSPGGSIFLETGCGQEAVIMEYARSIGIGEKVQCLYDLNHRQRFVRFDV